MVFFFKKKRKLCTQNYKLLPFFLLTEQDVLSAVFSWLDMCSGLSCNKKKKRSVIGNIPPEMKVVKVHTLFVFLKYASNSNGEMEV